MGFAIGILVFAKGGSPTQIYGLGTALNIYFMYISTPYYISLTCTKRTGNILKIGIVATLANAGGTWLLGKYLGLGTIGIIGPSVFANIMSFYVLRKDAIKVSFIHSSRRMKGSIFNEHLKDILNYARENTIGSLIICLSELALVIVALRLGEIGVLYGMFFALEKLFNSVTHATANATAIPFSERLHREAEKVNLRPFYGVALINSAGVTLFSIVALSFYQNYLALGPYALMIVGIVFFNSLDYFLRKVVLRPGGDARWTRIVNMYVIALTNFLIAAAVWFIPVTNWLLKFSSTLCCSKPSSVPRSLFIGSFPGSGTMSFNELFGVETASFFAEAWEKSLCFSRTNYSCPELHEFLLPSVVRVDKPIKIVAVLRL